MTDGLPPGDPFSEFISSGLWPGVGKALQGPLKEAGITSAHRVSVAELAKVPGVAQRRAERLYTSWIGAGQLYELVELLVPQDLPARWAGRLTDAIGDDAGSRLRVDPWRLLVLPDATVAQADRLARSLEPDLQRDDQRRARALVDWTLARFAKQGHTLTGADELAAALRPFGLDPVTATAAAVRSGLIRAITTDDGPMVARAALAEAEESIAEDLQRLHTSARSLAGVKAVKGVTEGLDKVQAGAVAALAEHGVSLLTGGPGTGKSRTVSAVVNLCVRVGKSIVLTAPTGRAAKRLEELTDHSATTVHRLLEARRIEGGSAFERSADNPIEADVVVVDEASMIDVQLCAALLAAIPDKAHLLIVGDPAQLPSIGPGRVLADLIESGAFPVTELTTLYRQAEGGAIARLAAAVRQGELTAPESGDHEVVVVSSRGSGEAAHRVVQVVTDSIPRVFGVEADQVQVVTPVHKGPAGTQELNRLLKAQLNPGRGELRGFDVGDRVVATANKLDAEPTGYANGEVGTVVAIKDKTLRVAFTGGEADVTGKAIGELLHGWAVTVHRAQGSEWEAVVVVLPPEAGNMLSRPLVYTALTRARRHLSIVHAAGPAVARAVRDVDNRPRRTRLPALLRATVVDDAAH